MNSMFLRTPCLLIPKSVAVTPLQATLIRCSAQRYANGRVPLRGYSSCVVTNATGAREQEPCCCRPRIVACNSPVIAVAATTIMRRSYTSTRGKTDSNFNSEGVGDNKDDFKTTDLQHGADSQAAAKLSQEVTRSEQAHFRRQEAEAIEQQEKQMRAPWMRAGSETAPVDKLAQRRAKPATGKLLTTPSRMLKLVLPLQAKDAAAAAEEPGPADPQEDYGDEYENDNEDDNDNNEWEDPDAEDTDDLEPLALLLHPQQPLSYLERLIQSEVPTINVDGKERPPHVIFKGKHLPSVQHERPGRPKAKPVIDDDHEHPITEKVEGGEALVVDGKVVHTGKIAPAMPAGSNDKPPQKPEGTASSGPQLPAQPQQDLPFSASGQDAPLSASNTPSPSTSENTDEDTHDDAQQRGRFVRWSPSTEIGDFIRDAARAKRFVVEIEGEKPIFVTVPSFRDRTYYLRMRLRKTSKRISHLADIKWECDKIARRGAKRVAQGGFMGLIAWWGLVYYLTFKTELGWDVMEPVTYLVGLSGLIGGYMWFLYHNREVSYRSAMKYTVSRRQDRLYDLHGFDPHEWDALVDEGNRLRREIKMVADEYDVDWDEKNDRVGAKVAKVLREGRRKVRRKAGKGKKSGSEEDEDDDDDD